MPLARTIESDIAASMSSFGELAGELTTAAVRVLAYTTLHDATAALGRRDYIAAREAATALMQTLAALEAGGGD